MKVERTYGEKEEVYNELEREIGEKDKISHFSLIFVQNLKLYINYRKIYYIHI